MMTSSNGNIFRVTGLYRLPVQSPVTQSFNVSEQTNEQTMETPVIWDAIALIMA